jgi:hypothetical protein
VQVPVECLAVLTKRMEREASRVGCVPDHMHHWVRGTAAAKYRRVYSRKLISAATASYSHFEIQHTVRSSARW